MTTIDSVKTKLDQYAAASLPFERPRVSVSFSVRGPAVLGERLDALNGGMKTVNSPLIEHEPTG